MSLIRMEILVIDGVDTRASALGEHLTTCGHVVDYAPDARRGLALSNEIDFGAVVIARHLPDSNGVDLVRSLRSAGVGALIMVVDEAGGYRDAVRGLDNGADDYRCGPTSHDEIGARLASMTQRGRLRYVVDEVVVGDLRLDARCFLLTRAGRPVPITRMQGRVLLELMMASPRPVTIPRLEMAVWGGANRDPSLLRSHMSALRQRIDHPFDTSLIRTHLNVGYSIAPD
jgi:two-component system OmpR family response regulator